MSRPRIVLTDKAPVPGGHYSQAIIHNGVVYVAGQIPIDPSTGEKKLGPIEEQTEQVLKNLEAILIAAGSSLDLVLKVTVYVSDMEFWPAVNKVYAEFFGASKPARAIVPVKDLHYGFKMEIDAIAAVGE